MSSEFEIKYFPAPNEAHSAVLWIPFGEDGLSVADFILPARLEVSPEYVQLLKANPSTDFKHEIREGELLEC